MGGGGGPETTLSHSELTIFLTSCLTYKLQFVNFPSYSSHVIYITWGCCVVLFCFFFFLLTRIQSGPFRVVVHTLKTAFVHFVSFSGKVWEGRWIMEAGFESLDG